MTGARKQKNTKKDNFKDLTLTLIFFKTSKQKSSSEG